jgi:spore germination protein YaaH
LRHTVIALVCGLVPTISILPAEAGPPIVSGPVAQATAPDQAAMPTIAGLAPGSKAIDFAPPVMDLVSRQEAAAPQTAFAAGPSQPQLALQAVANPRLFREVFGFAFASSLGDPTIGYPSWNFGLLSTVAYFGVHVTWTGEFSDDSALSTWNSPTGPVPGFIRTAHANGTKVVLTIIMMDSTSGTPNMCSALQRGSVTIQNTVSQVAAKGIDGVNVDYESNNSSCTDPSTGAVQSSQSLFTAFVHNLRAALPSSSYLTVDTYSGSAGFRSGSTYYGFFDISALANYVDAFFVMAYDMEYANGGASPLNCPSFCAGPTAPLTTYLYNDTRASMEYRAVVPGSKVIMGIPYYGRKECVRGYTPTTAPANAVGDTVVADGYLDASTEQGYYANSDYHTNRDARDPTGSTRWDTWTSSTAGCTREMYFDDVTSLGYKYNLVINDGLRGAGIFALNYGGGAPELWSLINLKFGQCSNATISADHSSPQVPATSITFTASAFCAGTAEYRFWIQPPGSAWSILQNYSTSSTVTWNTGANALGTYKFEVDARNVGSSVSYDTTANMPMRVALCVTPALTPDHASPQLPGTAVTFSATVTCQGTPEFRYWLQPPGGSWSVVQNYGPTSTLAWNTSGKPYGTYNVEVDARTQGTQVTYESVQTMPYALTSCITSTLTTDKTSPQPTGTRVLLTGSAACDSTPQYRFMVQPPGGAWSVLRDFDPASTFTWTAGGAAGTYGLEFDAKSTTAPVSSMASSSLTFDLAACNGAAISSAPTSPQVPGATVVVTGSATCTGTPLYRFQMRKPGASWSVVQNYGAVATFNWNTTGLPTGDYGLEVDIRNTGATADYETTANAIFTLAAQACTTPTLTSDLTTPQGTGAPVTFSATTTTCPNPVYRFWVLDPGGPHWSMVQDYSAASTYRWPAAGLPGGYGIEVDVRDVSRPVPYDAVANVTFTLTACTGATLTVNPASPQQPGTSVTLTGAATCPRTSEFRFWVQAPGSRWSIARDFATSSTFIWQTTTPGGTWGLEVDVRDVGVLATYETTASITYGVIAPCTLPSLSPSVASPQLVGTVVSFTGATGGCPTPTYRFWIQPPGGAYTVKQDWGTAATFSWSTTGLASGTYGVEVDVRNQGSAVSYDSARGVFFTLTSPSCSGPTITGSPGTPTGTGTAVTFTGATGGCPAPQFRFWVRPPNGSWSIARDYATAPAYSWPGGSVPGSYAFEVDVRGLGSSTVYDAVARSTYAVVACSAAALTANPASPQTHGTQIVLTASATCLGTPEYRFWIRAPGGSWRIVQDFAPGPTFTWTTTSLAAGTYQLEVDVRNHGAGATYETVMNIPFVLS